MSNTIPFGKYKDKPIEVLIADPTYTEWLLEQGWFKQRHSNIHTIIINHFKDSHEETPVHNAMQGRFLDDFYCHRFLQAVNPGLFNEQATIPDSNWRFKLAKGIDNIKLRRSFENAGIDIKLSFTVYYLQTLNYFRDIGYMEYGSDYYQTSDFNIEIKPTVGDDYPAILRQMKTTKCNILFVGEYHGVGISRDNFLKYFKNEGIRVVFESELMDESEYI